MSVRLDKWLQVARVFKSRSRATRACTLGRVRVNDSKAKPHRTLALEDRIEIDLRDWTRIVVVKVLRDRTVPKKDAEALYEDLSPPRPVLGPLERLLKRAPVERERGKGRPTKRERRDQDRFRGS